jgi:hypothetical protein
MLKFIEKTDKEILIKIIDAISDIIWSKLV